MTTISAAKDFLRYCRYEKNLSAKTLKAYSIDLTQLIEFLSKKVAIVNAEDITKFHMREYLELISHLKPKSVKRKLASAKAMFNYLEFEDCITVNPFRKMKIQIKDDKALPVVMTVSEIAKILRVVYRHKDKFAKKDNYSYFEVIRNIAVLELLFNTGARVSEIANLKKNCIDVNSGLIKLNGKGSKERILHICNHESLAILQQYCKLVNQRPKGIKNEYFLTNRLGNRISDQSIRILVKKISSCAGIGKKITPHVFRHSFATLLLEKDVDIKYIQSLLGHSSIMTTQIYTHVSKSKQRQILKTKHPRKDLTLYKKLDE